MPVNHTNSASHAGKRKWDEAINDAKECIKLNPSFIKGYYRLSSAQIEKNELDAAASTIKQGLNIKQPDNSQLQKLMRSIKLKKQVMKAEKQSDAAKAAAAATAGTGGAGAGVDSSLSKEIMDLQNELRATVRDYSHVNGDIVKAQKSVRVNEITTKELDALPKNSDVNMYMGVGKMFMAAQGIPFILA